MQQLQQRAFHCLAALTFILLNGNHSMGQTKTPSFPAQMVQRLNAMVEQYLRDKNLPSIAVGVWVPGAGQYVTAKGKANLATGAARNTTDPFRIASITKSFTATAVLQLIDQGLLSKTDKLAKWFPDFPNANLITIDDLLRMRSGIADSADEEMLKLYYQKPLVDFSPAMSFARSAAKKAQFIPPNQKTKYNNVNYNFLEVIVERVTGRRLGEQIAKTILKPLGMNNSLYPYDNKLPGHLRGYGLNPQTRQFEDKTISNPSLPGGAGAMISTLADLRVYARALAQGALLKPETHLERLQGQALEGAPDIVRYGQGIGQLGKFYGHNGTIMGFSTEMWYLPEKDAVIVINVNRLDADDRTQAGELFFLMAKLLFPEHVSW